MTARRWLLALPAAALLACAAPPPALGGGAPEVSMSGSTTTLPLVADLAYFYRRGHRTAPRFSLVGGGTSAGIGDVARGIVSAGLASRVPAPSDPPGLVFTPLALSAICLVTNRANPVPGFSRALVQDLVAGRVTTWAQVPGARRTDAIAAVGTGAGTGGRVVFVATFLDPATPIAWAPVLLPTAAQVREEVLATPAAWAYVDLVATAGLHVVPYEGIPCTRATVRSGAYPAIRPLSVVTRGAPAGQVARFLRWIRASPVAQRVIATRYVPAR